MRESIHTTDWGVVDSKDVYLYRITNSHGTTLELSNYGAGIVSLIFPDKFDAIVGEKNFGGYTSGKHPHFGLTTGRLAGRSKSTPFLWPREDILSGSKDSSITVQKEYQLISHKPDGVHLHGDTSAIGRRVWDAQTVHTNEFEGLRFSIRCHDGDGGYPGDIHIHTLIALYKDKNTVHISYEATSESFAPVNLTNHSYFNLGDSNVLENTLELQSDRVFDYNESALVKSPHNVENTPFDLRTPKPIGTLNTEIQRDDISSRGGLDHVFETRNPHLNSPSNDAIRHVATMRSPNGNALHVNSTSTAIVCYASCTLGKYSDFKKYQALCLETQNSPGFLHDADIPASYASPSQPWLSFTEYEFHIK